jgi:hypothetical protein
MIAFPRRREINQIIPSALTKSDYSDSAWWLKFNHAEEFRHKLSAELEEIEQAFPPSIELVSWDGKVLKYLLTSNSPTRLHWSLIVGDSLHNYRSALDALYFSVIKALAKRHAREIDRKVESNLHFPICSSAREFKSTAGLKKYGTTTLRDDLLIHQPFLRSDESKDIKNHPLELLRLLSNQDKHRQLNPIQTILSDYALFHDAGLQVVSGRKFTQMKTPNKYLFEFDVLNGKASDRIDFIPRFTTGVSLDENELPSNSIQNLLGLISGQIYDYLHKIEYHLEHDLGELIR